MQKFKGFRHFLFLFVFVFLQAKAEIRMERIRKIFAGKTTFEQRKSTSRPQSR